MKKPLLHLVLRLIVVQTLVGLLGIVIAMALGAPLSRGIITFTDNITDNGSDIYVLDVARQITYNLTQSLTFDSSPVWSPDGSQLVFTSTRGTRAIGRTAIYLMDASGRNVRRVATTEDYTISAPAWSSDGRYLAYVINSDSRLDMQVLDLQTDRQYRVTHTDLETLSPRWSPDGAMLAFQGRQRTANTSFNLYVLDITHLENPDVGLRKLVVFSRPFSPQEWSPDGRFIALNHIRDGTENANWDIGIVDVASGEMVFETVNPAADIQPAWSPDSTMLAFRSTRDGDADIYIVDVNTGEIRQLTNDADDQSFPLWSPDGREIVYLSEEVTGYVFYMMDSNGGTPRYLAPGLWTSTLVWQPNPSSAGGASP